MKKVLLLLLGSISMLAHSQTVDEVIQKYAFTMGGLDAYNKIKTAKFTGIYATQGNEYPLTSIVVNGQASRTDIDVMGQAIVNCYSNGKGWKINPFGGAKTATDVTGTELNDFRVQSTLANQLMDYKARGHQVELLADELVEGINTFKVKLTNKDDGKVTTYNINKADYVLVRSASVRELQGRSTEIEIIFSDLKAFGDVKFFMSRDSKMGGQVFQSVTYSRIELNVPVDEKIFIKP